MHIFSDQIRSFSTFRDYLHILNAVASFFNALATEHNISTHLKVQWRTTVPTATNQAHMAFHTSWRVVPLNLTQI